MRLDAAGLEIAEFLRGYDKLMWLYRVCHSVEAGGAHRPPDTTWITTFVETGRRVLGGTHTGLEEVIFFRIIDAKTKKASNSSLRRLGSDIYLCSMSASVTFFFFSSHYFHPPFLPLIGCQLCASNNFMYYPDRGNYPFCVQVQLGEIGC